MGEDGGLPVMVAAGWTEAQKRAYVLARSAGKGQLTPAARDPELLRLELGELKLGGFDLSLTGFGDLELKDLLTAAAFVGDEWRLRVKHNDLFWKTSRVGEPGFEFAS